METPAKNSRANMAIQVIKHTNNGLTVVDAKFQELMMILITQTEALKKVLQAALDATTSPKDRLAILKYMDQKEKELQKKFAKSSHQKDTAREFLTGPTTRSIQRHSSSRTNPDTRLVHFLT